jgi:hypothetical protein
MAGGRPSVRLAWNNVDLDGSQSPLSSGAGDRFTLLSFERPPISGRSSRGRSELARTLKTP